MLRWARVQKWSNVSNVVCLVVDGNIGAADLQKALAKDSAADSGSYTTRYETVYELCCNTFLWHFNV